MDKLKLFIDCDDTILNSSVAVIDIINKKYNKNSNISFLKDWNYNSIESTLTKKDVYEIYESMDFWNSIKINEDFKKHYTNIIKNFDVCFISKGTQKNLELKELFLKREFGKDVCFVGVKIFPGFYNEEKNKVDMCQGIQIDDRSDELRSTNAKLKILLKNYRNFKWNKPIENLDNLYVVNDWDQIFEILDFYARNLEVL